MSIRAHCTICTASFSSTNVFALPCGHTFHEECVGQWLKGSGHGCPNCRRKCRGADVTRIFFEAGLNDTLNSTSQDDPTALLVKNEDLQSRLDEAIAEAKQSKQNLLAQINEKAELEKQVLSEKKAVRKTARKLELKEAELVQVRSLLQDVDNTKQENQTLKQQIEASEFYKELFRGSKPLDAIQSYITNRGDPDGGKFLELQTRALIEERKQRRQLAKDLETKNQRIHELEMEKKQLQESVRLLMDECKNHGVTTPQNPKAKKLLALSPPRRDSLDVFNGSINDQVLNSVVRGKGPIATFLASKTSKPTWSAEKRKWLGGSPKATTPLKRCSPVSNTSGEKSTIPTVDLVSPNSDEFDKIRVPSKIAKRVLKPTFQPGTGNKTAAKSGSDGMGGSIHRPSDRALTRIENSTTATKRPTPTIATTFAKNKFATASKCSKPDQKDELITLD